MPANKPAIQVVTRNLPEDVYKILLKKQAEIRIACACQFNLEKTIFKIIKFVEDKDISQ